MSVCCPSVGVATRSPLSRNRAGLRHSSADAPRDAGADIAELLTRRRCSRLSLLAARAGAAAAERSWLVGSRGTTTTRCVVAKPNPGAGRKNVHFRPVIEFHLAESCVSVMLVTRGSLWYQWQAGNRKIAILIGVKSRSHARHFRQI